MKTILCVYTNTKITSSKELGKLKRYSFNTPDDLKEGDLIETKEYSTNLQIVKVLDKAFKYFNGSTGQLSDKFDSTSQWVIRTLKISEEDEEIILGKLVITK